MSRRRRLAMVNRGHPGLSVVKQCRLLQLSRSAVYYRPTPNGRDGPAVSEDALLWFSQDDGLAPDSGASGQPQAGMSTDAGQWGWKPSTASPVPASLRRNTGYTLTCSKE